MATNDFIGFASAGSANIMSQADYAAAAEQIDGVQPGPASSALANKIWRQGANMAAALGQLIADQGLDARDNGDIAALQKAVATAMAYVVAYDASVDYIVGSLVRYNNKLFLAIAQNGPNSTVANPSNNSFWLPIESRAFGYTTGNDNQGSVIEYDSAEGLYIRAGWFYLGSGTSYTFNRPFPAGVYPKIVATARSATSTLVCIKVDNVTNTGFDVYAISNTNSYITSANLEYIAVAFKSN